MASKEFKIDRLRVVIDKDENKRFTHFRKTFIDKNQTRAAKLMGLSQGALSYVETFKRPVPAGYYNILVDKFKLNENWLRKGEGTPQVKGEPVKNNLTTLVELGTKISALERKVDIMQANHNQALMYIERMIKILHEHGVPTPKMSAGKQ